MTALEASEGRDSWRYAVAFAKFIIHTLYSGVPTSLSALIPSLAYQLDVDTTTVGFLITLEVGMFFFACPISNYVFQKFNPRLVATLGGFLAAISLMAACFSNTAASLGCSFFFTGFFSSPLRQISSVTLEQHFGDKFGFAETVTHVGGQLGSFFLPYLTVMCLNAYGIRGALLFLSALMFHCVPMGATMRPPRPQSRSEMMGADLNKRDEDDDREVNPLQNVDACESDENDLHIEIDIKVEDQNDLNSAADSTDQPLIGKGRANMKAKTLSEDKSHVSMILTAIRDYIRSALNDSFLMNERVFMYLLLPCEGIYEICYASWAFYSYSYGVSVGISVEKAVYIVMMESVGGITGRAVLIAVLFKYPLSTPQMLAANIGIAAIGLLAFSINTSLTYLMIFSFVSGFGFFNSFSSFYGFVSIIVKKENFAKAMSYSLMQTGGSLMLSGILTGFLYDILGSYQAIFRIMGLLLVVDCLAISTFIFVYYRSKQAQDQKIQLKPVEISN